MKRNPPGRPKSHNRIIIEKLMETKTKRLIKRMSETGELAIPLQDVRTAMKYIRRTEKRKER